MSIEINSWPPIPEIQKISLSDNIIKIIQGNMYEYTVRFTEEHLAALKILGSIVSLPVETVLAYLIEVQLKEVLEGIETEDKKEAALEKLRKPKEVGLGG